MIGNPLARVIDMNPKDRRAAYGTSGVIADSEIDGWFLGLIGNPWLGPWPKRNGDLFVIAPDGRQAGVAWESAGPCIKLILGPDAERWGVFQVRFPIPVMCMADIVRNFHEVLPLLKEQHRKAGG
jgi:hypothetical protein